MSFHTAVIVVEEHVINLLLVGHLQLILLFGEVNPSLIKLQFQPSAYYLCLCLGSP